MGDTDPELGADWAGLSEVLSAQGRLRLRQEEIFSSTGGREGGKVAIVRTSFVVSTYKQSGFLRVKVTEMAPLFWGGILRETWSFQGPPCLVSV